MVVDFSAKWYDDQIFKETGSIIIYSMVSVILGVTLVFLSTIKLRKQLKSINTDISEVIRDVDDLTNEIKAESSQAHSENAGNLHDLSIRLHQIREDLRQYLRSLHTQTNNMITALGTDYRGVYYVDLDKGEGVCFKAMEDIENGLKPGQTFSYKDIMARYAEKTVTENYRERFLSFVDPGAIIAALNEERLLTYLYTVRRNGEEYYEMIRISAVEPDDPKCNIGHAVGIGITNVDAETRKALVQSEVLKNALAAAEEANMAKTAFLSNMSHEIRTPMNAIIGLDSLALKSENLSDETREYLEKIDGSAKHLLGIINDILDMSRIESGRLVLRKEEFSFSGLLEQINTMVMSQCREKGLSYECRVHGGTSDYYIGDALKLKQVLINILSNAVKFTEAPGCVWLTVERTAVFGNYSTLKFSIKDTGIGMDPSYIPRVFDAFSQEDSSRSNKYGSTGLGMAITKNIVKLMNGTISVESEKGVGTEFTVVISLTNSEYRHISNGFVNTNDMRVLVVDDEKLAAEHAEILLDEAGIKSDICFSGEEAIKMLELCHAKHDPYNLVLLDWKMPKMDGLEVTREIRKRFDEETTVIILTSYNWEEIIDEAQKIGVDGFLTKPMFVSNVIEEFERVAKRNNMALYKEKRRADIKDKRILMAEDIQINAEIIKAFMQAQGTQIDHAENGKIAVEMFQDSEIGYYDAILMDVRMPEMDGLEATRKIRETDRPDASTVPIIAMTANAFDEDVQRSLQVGMNAHLSKPIEPEKLIQTLEELIWEAENKE